MRTKLAILLFIFGGVAVKVSGQKWMIKDKTIGEIRAICDPYFDSLRSVQPDSIFNKEGGEYRRYKEFMNYWLPLLGHSVKISDYTKAQLNSYNKRHTIPSISDPWDELGPTNWTPGLLGVGPIEFITFNPSNSNKMLCGSLAGGLFYSSNGGTSWQRTGSDTKWMSSGCAHAIFDPLDATGNTWYAITSGAKADGEASFMGHTGGIYRTTDAGQTWSLIADYNNFFCGIWVRYIQGKLINTLYGPVYAIGTSCGLYFLDLTSGVLTQEYSGYITDVGVAPGNGSVLYACINFTGTNPNASPASGLIKSIDGGLTWNPVAGLPTSITDYSHLSIEFSSAAPQNIYLLAIWNPYKTMTASCSGDDCIYFSYFHLFNGVSWQSFPELIRTYFGTGYGFAVNQSNPNEFICVETLGYNVVQINPTTLSFSYNTPLHSDVEDIEYSPTNNNEVWFATHGGVVKYTIANQQGVRLSDGLGVSMPFRMSTSVSTPDVLMMGAWHDATIYSTVPYSVSQNTYPNWQYHWRTFGDGMQPMVDPQNVNYLYASHQGLGGSNLFSSVDGGANFDIPIYSGIYNYFGNVSASDKTFNTDGIINKIDPQIIYILGLTPNPTPDEEVFRNPNRLVGQFDAISNFETQLSTEFPGLTWYDIYGLYNHDKSKDELYVLIGVQYNDANGFHAENHIYRTNIATQAPALVQNSWVRLTLPRLSDLLSGVTFDPINPSILYLTYGSSSLLNPTAFSGTQMLYRINYTQHNPFPDGTCPNGLCQDLTYNLPNTGLHGNSLVAEKGTNGNLYLASQSGVYVLNNNFITDGSYWHLFGEAPHIGTFGMEANYRNNKLRLASYGRGFWEHSLLCPADPTLYFSGAQNVSQFCEAVNEIVSTSTISSGTNISYRAGTYVHLQPGFTTSSNTTFHAFVHGCNQPGSSFRMLDQEDDQAGNIGNVVKTAEIEVFPNPSAGEFTLKVSEFFAEQPYNVVIYNTNGQEVFSQQQSAKSTIQLSLPELPDGVYVVWVFSGETRRSQKFIIHD